MPEDTWLSGKYFGSDGSIHARRFIDADNSAYYVDPNGGSRLSATYADYHYSYGDIRAGNHLIATQRVIVGEGQGDSWIEMRDTNEGTRYVHNNGSSIGFVSNGGGWTLRSFDNGDLWAGGNISAYSDESLKTNWRDLGESFVEKLASVKVGIYDRTDTALTQVGVSAQSLQEVLPDAIGEIGGKLTVAYGNAALASSVMLAKEVVELKQTVSSLTDEIAQLKQMLSKLLEQ